jgi:hypothetical protein
MRIGWLPRAFNFSGEGGTEVIGEDMERQSIKGVWEESEGNGKEREKALAWSNEGIFKQKC